MVILALAQPGLADSRDKPACKKLEALYISLAEKSGETASEADVKEAVYGENPSNADCAMMLSLFPAQD